MTKSANHLGNGENGRDGNGRFAPGYRGGPGRPKSLHRATLRKCITVDEVKKSVAVLVELRDNSKDERIRMECAKEILNRTCGKPPTAPDDELREAVERLEQRQEEILARNNHHE